MGIRNVGGKGYGDRTDEVQDQSVTSRNVYHMEKVKEV